MLTLENLITVEKDDLDRISKTLNKNDIAFLVNLLNEKEDKIRYQALLLLQCRSAFCGDVYPFWDTFSEKLKSTNSYQRSIGLMLIAENTQWDSENRSDNTLDRYLMLLEDEKPITIRQCIQSLSKIIPFKKHLNLKIAEKLMSINISGLRETMKKLILLDILEILALIRGNQTTDEIENYIFNALSGEILDKKAKKQIESVLRCTSDN